MCGHWDSLYSIGQHGWLFPWSISSQVLVLGIFLSHYHCSFWNQMTHPYLGEMLMSALVSCALAVPVGSVCMGTQYSWGKSDQPSLSELCVNSKQQL